MYCCNVPNNSNINKKKTSRGFWNRSMVKYISILQNVLNMWIYSYIFRNISGNMVVRNQKICRRDIFNPSKIFLNLQGMLIDKNCFPDGIWRFTIFIAFRTAISKVKFWFVIRVLTLKIILILLWYWDREVELLMRPIIYTIEFIIKN